jgi:hypothetical protein
MKHPFSFRSVLGALIALSVLLSGRLSGQGITTAGIAGFAVDPQGKAVAGATVAVVHEPTGTRASTTSRGNGQFDLSGLRVGGPYTVTISASGFKTETRSDIYLEIGTKYELNVSLVSDVVKMEAFKVTEERDLTFGGGKIGAGSSFDEQQVLDTPTVRRSLHDIAQIDPRLVVMSFDTGGQMSTQGQNYRYNSFLIDGVDTNDTFGLNTNGFSSIRNPIPLEALQSLSVELNPYDVRKTNFSGALLNAVTKSGTNEFHGSATYQYSDQDWRAKNPVTGVRDTFRDTTQTYTLNGPIWKDHIFFALSYDEFYRISAPPARNVTIDSAALAAVVTRAQALGYQPGSMDASNVQKQRTMLAKVDWNINEAHRLTLTYRRNHGEDTNFASYTGNTQTSFSNYWFQQPRNNETYTAQLFSTWTPNLRTEVNYSTNEYDGSPKNHGTPFPEVTINGLPGTLLATGAATTNASVRLGTEFSRQLNFITTKQKTGNISADYSIGDHTVSFGVGRDETKYANKFAQAVFGSYTFSNLANFQAGTPIQSYTAALLNPGFTLDQAFAEWRYINYGLFVQDTWKPNRQLTLLGGVRVDYPDVPEKPPVAPGFQAAFGIRNDTTNDGNYLVEPRVGFVYDLQNDRKTQVRGGVGLFTAKSPAVWLSNAFSNAGAIGAVQATNPAITFQPDVTKQPVPAGSPPVPNINVTDPSFKQPSLWKTNIAVDHALPFGGLVLTAEYDYNRVQNGATTKFLNFLRATSGPTVAPDGRERYAGPITSTLSGSPFTSAAGRRRVSTVGDVYYLTNANKGQSSDFTLSLNRPMKNHWAASYSWTHSRGTEVSPMTSFTAGSNFNQRASFNPNDDEVSTSNYTIDDNMVATLTWQFEFVKNARTDVSLVYRARTGRPYSWVFYGDANGDGFTFNDLFYVPTGPNDPKVTWSSTTERDAFFAFVNSSNLSKYKGSAVPRNSERSPWNQTLDIKITQDIPLPYTQRVKLQAFLNIINFANLIDKKWGLLEEVPFAFRRAVAGATYNATGNGGQGAWVYTYTPTTLNAVPITTTENVSRWQVQFGGSLKF